MAIYYRTLQQTHRVADRGNNGDTRYNLKTPDLEKLLELRTQPTTENETPVELATRNFPLEFFVEMLLLAAVGSKGWREDMCTKKLSDTRATISDEAFVLLCLENMWGK